MYDAAMFSYDALPHVSKFSSKERDSGSGLDDFGARYLSSATGRFTSPDPLYLEAHRPVDQRAPGVPVDVQVKK